LNTEIFRNFLSCKTTLYDFLDFILNNLKFDNYKIKGGFISYLDESKVSSRFKIISATGRFINSNNIKIISAKEIDKLSIVFMKKESLIKDNLYIDIINKNSEDIFIYLEFDKNINNEEKLQFKTFFNELNDMILHTQWDENMQTILTQIENLAPLSKTILDTLSFSTKSNKQAEELVDILSTDPIIITNLLKTINSAMFGFRNEVESVENLIYLMGIDFTISMVLSNSIEDSLSTNVDAYGLDQVQFKEFLALKLKFISSWLRKENPELLKKIYLPLILQDLGKFIISKELTIENKTDQFLQELKKDPQYIHKVERKYYNCTSTEVSILILEHWNFNQNFINALNGECKQVNKTLKLVNTIFNIIKPLDKNMIDVALKQATSLDIDIDLLKKEIELLITNE
jgi:HD-like signal output (HDOD) protein